MVYKTFELLYNIWYNKVEKREVSMNIANEIKMIRELLGLSQQELADELDVSFQTVNRWEASSNEIEQRNIDKIYEYAYNKGIQINKIKEMFLIDENNYDDNVLLFHGAKKNFSLPVVKEILSQNLIH